MNRTTAVETWREVCGSDTVMAMMPPTGRMLEEFARRIEAGARESCAVRVACIRQQVESLDPVDPAPDLSTVDWLRAAESAVRSND